MSIIAILTISDRSAAGIYPDLSGPALQQTAETAGHQVAENAVIPDDLETIKVTLRDWCDSDRFDVILTTGGTGFTSRDITPEATLAVIDRVAPGIVEAIRAESLKITPYAMLSRAVAGIRKSTLIINFPGSPKAALENFNIVAPILEHATALLRDRSEAESGHQAHKN